MSVTNTFETDCHTHTSNCHATHYIYTQSIHVRNSTFLKTTSARMRERWAHTTRNALTRTSTSRPRTCDVWWQAELPIRLLLRKDRGMSDPLSREFSARRKLHQQLSGALQLTVSAAHSDALAVGSPPESRTHRCHRDPSPLSLSHFKINKHTSPITNCSIYLYPQPPK